MSNIAEDIFGNVEKCPFCKSKRIRAITCTHTIYDKVGDAYYQEDENFGDTEYSCQKCGKTIEVEE